MKPKIALAKYLDWAILALLAAALILVAARAFLLKRTGEETLREEVTRYDAAVQKGINDTSGQPLQPHDYLGELQNRFEHPAVLDPYRRNPFLTREDVPHPSLQLRVGVPRTLRFTGTRFTRMIAGDEQIVHVDIAYDLPTGVSTVTFIPLAAGESSVRIQTDEDVVHLFKISVRTVERPPPPNPPINVAVVVRAAVQLRGTVKPAMVLISFLPDDPQEPSRTVGLSNNAAIYRKAAGASDAEYVRLDDPDEPLAPLNRDQIHAIMLNFQIPEVPAAGAETAAPTAPATAATPTTPAGAAPSSPPVPEAVTEIRVPGSAAAAAAQSGEPETGSFVFLDQTVDDGESYIYKIVTLSAAPDVEPVPCDVPYVSPGPVFVPSFVDFAVRTITADSATVRITRRDPDTGEWLPPQDFTVGAGQQIGGVRTIKVRVPRPAGLPPIIREKEVDFSTGCILVNALPNFHFIEYKLRWGPNFTAVYQAKDTRDPQVLYLTPRGALHFKSKEITAGLDNRVNPGVQSPRRAPSRDRD